MPLSPRLFTVIEGDLYAWKLSQLGESEDVDLALTDLLFALAGLAPDCPLEEGSERVRVITSRPMLGDDGEVIRLTIRFVARHERGEVELLDVEALPVEPSA